MGGKENLEVEAEKVRAVEVIRDASGSFALLRMTARTGNGEDVRYAGCG